MMTLVLMIMVNRIDDHDGDDDRDGDVDSVGFPSTMITTLVMMLIDAVCFPPGMMVVMIEMVMLRLCC